MKQFRLLFLILLFMQITLSANATTPATTKPKVNKPTVNKTDKWHGYSREHFVVDGRKCYVVTPTKHAHRKPWVWRARFPDYHWEIDVKLLEQGIAIAYIDVAGMFGSPKAVAHGNKFYQEMQNRGYEKKVALEGVSRGGLFVYNWTAANLDKVSCIYTDTPVCDFKSWPLGQGKGIGHKNSWNQCLKAYGMTEAEALAYKKNPINNVEKIAKAGIPMMTIVSMNDVVVPPAENTFVMQERVPKHLRQRGFRIIKVSEGTQQSKGHHFKHPNIVGVYYFFMMYHILYEGGSVSDRDIRTLKQIKEIYSTIPPIKFKALENRFRYLKKTEQLIKGEKKLRVVMLGDSIINNTSRSQWHLLVQEKHPKCQITKVTSVRGSTGCWWYQDNHRVIPFVIDQKPDLVIIGGISQRGDIAAIKSVIQQIRKHSQAEILLMSGVFGRLKPDNKEAWQSTIDEKKTPYRFELRKLASEQKCAFFDIRSPWTDYMQGKVLKSFYADTVHANAKGEQVIGHLLAKFLSP